MFECMVASGTVWEELRSMAFVGGATSLKASCESFPLHLPAAYGPATAPEACLLVPPSCSWTQPLKL